MSLKCRMIKMSYTCKRQSKSVARAGAEICTAGLLPAGPFCRNLLLCDPNTYAWPRQELSTRLGISHLPPPTSHVLLPTSYVSRLTFLFACVSSG